MFREMPALKFQKFLFRSIRVEKLFIILHKWIQMSEHVNFWPFTAPRRTLTWVE